MESMILEYELMYEQDSDEGEPGTFVPGSGIMAKLHMGISTSNRTRVYREGKDFITSVGVSLLLHQGVIGEGDSSTEGIEGLPHHMERVAESRSDDFMHITCMPEAQHWHF